MSENDANDNNHSIRMAVQLSFSRSLSLSDTRHGKIAINPIQHMQRGLRNISFISILWPISIWTHAPLPVSHIQNAQQNNSTLAMFPIPIKQYAIVALRECIQYVRCPSALISVISNSVGLHSDTYMAEWYGMVIWHCPPLTITYTHGVGTESGYQKQPHSRFGHHHPNVPISIK